MEPEWHVADTSIRVSYGVFDRPTEALREAVKFMRQRHPDACGEGVFYKDNNSTDWGTLYYDHKPFLCIIKIDSQRLIPARFNP